MAKNLLAHELSHTVQQGSSRNKLTEDHKKTFGDSGYKAKTLKAGTVLHRLCSHGTRNLLSDFWIDDATFTTLIRKVQTAGALFDQKIGVAVKRNQIRNELALKTNWRNSLTHRQKITLKQDVVSYVGSIKPQSHYVNALENPRKDPLPMTHASARKAQKQVEFRVGGLKQYVIPRFAKSFNEQIDSNPLVDGKVFRLFRQAKYKSHS